MSFILAIVSPWGIQLDSRDGDTSCRLLWTFSTWSCATELESTWNTLFNRRTGSGTNDEWYFWWGRDQSGDGNKKTDPHVYQMATLGLSTLRKVRSVTLIIPHWWSTLTSPGRLSFQNWRYVFLVVLQGLKWEQNKLTCQNDSLYNGNYIHSTYITQYRKKFKLAEIYYDFMALTELVPFKLQTISNLYFGFPSLLSGM